MSSRFAQLAACIGTAFFGRRDLSQRMGPLGLVPSFADGQPVALLAIGGNAAMVCVHDCLKPAFSSLAVTARAELLDPGGVPCLYF